LRGGGKFFKLREKKKLVRRAFGNWAFRKTIVQGGVIKENGFEGGGKQEKRHPQGLSLGGPGAPTVNEPHNGGKKRRGKGWGDIRKNLGGEENPGFHPLEKNGEGGGWGKNQWDRKTRADRVTKAKSIV